MSYENKERERSKQTFQAVRAVIMGLFFAALGSIMVFTKRIGNYDLPWYVAYTLGPVMMVGGAIRFYRGLMDMLPSRKKGDDPDRGV
jgi:hypothetical protein